MRLGIGLHKSDIVQAFGRGPLAGTGKHPLGQVDADSLAQGGERPPCGASAAAPDVEHSVVRSESGCPQQQVSLTERRPLVTLLVQSLLGPFGAVPGPS